MTSVSTRRVKPFTIEKVESIPPSKRPRTAVYSELIEDIMKREKGYYKISIEGKRLQTVYQLLNKCIKKDKLPLKVYIRGKELYLEKME